MLMLSARRPTASLGALLGVLAGAWFVVGPTVSQLWNDGVSQAGTVHGSDTLQVEEAATAEAGAPAAPATTGGRLRRHSRLGRRDRGATSARRDPTVGDR